MKKFPSAETTGSSTKQSMIDLLQQQYFEPSQQLVDPRLSIGMVTPVSNGASSLASLMGAPTGPYFARDGDVNNGSTTSLASSINSDFGESAYSRMTNFNGASGATTSFTPQFTKLVNEIYQLVCSDPQVTPFDNCNPPSGVLDKVAKISLQQAEQREIQIGYERSNYLMTLVRHHLLSEVKKEQYLVRNCSASSISGPNVAPKQFTDLLGNTANIRPRSDTLERIQNLQSYQSVVNNGQFVMTPNEPDNGFGGQQTQLGSSINLANWNNSGPAQMPLFNRPASRTSSPLSGRVMHPTAQFNKKSNLK
ncbi:Cip1p KNAG_0D02570 [Huiozyma naganishii CBS 8797]|uniref:Uncharacterized protein n=1 Tax=Huiozyma naganishii (strain ATCC MYA-139 / BCRC 22969 / CBS 8797 / KCTC 17520 / NBRC 10181 / NCYC 3082 / Yp74L-3) TaxID=1071383 RepID=J7S6Z3_HUIN7|nr:hypothetical protein KNAG_0D02570 [Kazachstania naganishii CBS 8797]CCK70006.1 hypothetical protein KNAG_0D02570 [Kazachstania naganishii CBS 8797]